MNIEVHGVQELQRYLTFAQREAFPEASVRAVNRTLDKMNTLTVRSVAEVMGAKTGRVRSRIKKRKMRRDAIDLGAELVLDGAAFNLIEFNAKKGEKGVEAAPWNKTHVFPGSFIARMNNGAKLVMIRSKRGGKRVARLPIRPMLGPSVTKSALEPKLVREREALIRDFMPKELERQLELLCRPKANLGKSALGGAKRLGRLLG